MSELVMVKRFQRKRWSDIRIKMDLLKKGECLAFPVKDKYSAKTTVARFNDAYEGQRKFSTKTTVSHIWVERVI